ncbi:XdhC/CoxI family protein [bacterium]|nr:XdhC/CoxI family protein [bacterium]
MNQRFYEKIVEWTRQGKRIAVISVIETKGSTPRKPGTKMLVTSDMEIFGTIGGGCVEADVIFAARDVLKTLVPRVVRVDIKAKSAEEMDMLCGGEISLYVEPVMPDFRLVICGGGHISKALAHVATGLDFHISVIDDRPQFANTDRFPSADETLAAPYEKLAEKIELTPQTFVVIVTRGHLGDEACLRQVLKTPACFIAMIGSRSKWANIKKNLAADGFKKKDLDRVHSPAGLDIGSITPEEIAVSVIAQVIQERARMMREGFPVTAKPPKRLPTSKKAAKKTAKAKK